MAIVAKKPGSSREPIPAGNYIARCYKMIHIGLVEDEYNGESKTLDKVRLSWELSTELKTFNEEKGPQPLSIDKEYTLSMHEKASLRKDLESWIGKSLTPEQVESFDITQLLDKFCMLNIIHVQSQKGNTYDKIASIASVPKGVNLPEKYNETSVFDYEENFDASVMESLPTFIKDRMKTSQQFKDIESVEIASEQVTLEANDLPFD